MSPYVLTSTALDDLEEIVEYVRRDKPQAAESLAIRFEEKFALLASSPSIGDPRPEFGDGVRSATVGRFVVYYRGDEAEIVILRVLAGERDIREL